MKLNMLSRFCLKSLIYKVEKHLNILKTQLGPQIVSFSITAKVDRVRHTASPHPRFRSPLVHSVLHHVLPGLFGCLLRTPIFKFVQKYK